MSHKKTKIEVVEKSIKKQTISEIKDDFWYMFYDGYVPDIEDFDDYWDEYLEDKRRDDIIIDVLDLQKNPKFGDIWPR